MKFNIVTAPVTQWGLPDFHEYFRNVIADHGMLNVEATGGLML